MSDESNASASSDIDCSLISMSGLREGLDDEVLEQMEDDIVAWLEYCRSAKRMVGMFLWILAHRKGYRQVQTLFGYSLQTISHHFKRDLRVVVALAANMVKSHHDYNDGAPSHSLNAARAKEMDDDEIEVDLPDVDDEIEAKNDAIGDEDIPWQHLRDYMAQALS
ncbi:Hypothetical predicted protein [Olea europaea subsp. europaea]|uniref:DUF8040 domain-containing protein n=1 Tax=Olea europaea subsp. europaea TaxID=158383 RepID=A0A8S0QM73_OLEEU|nr:Hypothetical predicted protein [Olea europaea subsp. europaea]